jgi:hypothetical protein
MLAVCLIGSAAHAGHRQLIGIRHFTERPPLVQWRTLVLAMIIAALGLKAFGYLVNIVWLMVYGPRVVARIHTAMDEGRLSSDGARDIFVRRLENYGSSEVGEGRRAADKRIARLRFVRPARRPSTKAAWPRLYRFMNVAAATPVLLSATGLITATIIARGAPVWPTVTTVALLCGVATASFVIAPIAHICMGSYDVHSAGLQPYVRRYRKWAPEGVQGGRNPILLYFLAVFFVVTFTYALCYNILYILEDEQFSARFDAFHLSNPDPNLLTWLYYSATTAATVGYGDIYPVNHWSQLVVIAQIFSGPVLITWLLATVLTDQARSPRSPRKAL